MKSGLSLLLTLSRKWSSATNWLLYKGRRKGINLLYWATATKSLAQIQISWMNSIRLLVRMSSFLRMKYRAVRGMNKRTNFWWESQATRQIKSSISARIWVEAIKSLLPITHRSHYHSFTITKNRRSKFNRLSTTKSNVWTFQNFIHLFRRWLKLPVNNSSNHYSRNPQ